eukprot:tig00000430_g604.t1
MSRRQEVEEAFETCIRLIDHPPAEYRIVKQAIMGLTHIVTVDDDLRARGILKIMQLVQADPATYRSNPRRFAVRSLGWLTYFDESMVVPAVQLLVDKMSREHEPSQYVRKGVFCALSRIGRKYPNLQEYLVPLFKQRWQDPKEKSSILWGVLIGLGRMAQTNARLRCEFAKDWIKACRSRDFHIRQAGIRGLGFAVCNAGNVKSDPALAIKCYLLCRELLRTGGMPELIEEWDGSADKDPFKREEVYMVQYGALQALGHLLRSDPDEWWPRMSEVFAEVLQNARYAAMVKASALLTFGKLAYFIAADNPFLAPIKELLYKLSEMENILVSEPAIYALTNFALAHPDMYPRLRTLLEGKIGGSSVGRASEHALLYFLKTWCKLVSREYRPILNHRRPARQSVVEIAHDDGALRRLCAGFSPALVESVYFLMTSGELLENAAFLATTRALIEDYQVRNKSLRKGY